MTGYIRPSMEDTYRSKVTCITSKDKDCLCVYMDSVGGSKMLKVCVQSMCLSFFISMIVGPDITLGASVVATLEGDNATLICGTNLTGNPEPTIQWMDNNNTEVRRNDSRFVFNDGPEIVSLDISNVTVEDDGMWICNVQVENVSEVQQNITLVVVGKEHKILM